MANQIAVMYVESIGVSLQSMPLKGTISFKNSLSKPLLTLAMMITVLAFSGDNTVSASATKITPSHAACRAHIVTRVGPHQRSAFAIFYKIIPVKNTGENALKLLFARHNNTIKTALRHSAATFNFRSSPPHFHIERMHSPAVDPVDDVPLSKMVTVFRA